MCVHVYYACVHACVCAHVASVWWSGKCRGWPCPKPPVHTHHQEEGGGPFLLMIPWSWGISQRTHLPRTKQNPQRFFPVSDSRKLPALSSACRIHSLPMSQPFFISWHFPSHPFSFVPLSVQAALPLCLCRVYSPCLCLSLPPPWPSSQSVTFLSSPPGSC